MPFSPSVRRALYPLLIVTAFFAFGGGVRWNASDPIHWDVPIYLWDAQADLEQGSMLRRVDGDRVLANLSERVESGTYRRVSRYGNAWIIAQVLRFGPGGLTGIVHARAFYSLLMLAYLLVLYVFLSDILPTPGPAPNHGGAAVVVLLTIATPLFRYLNGNLVSEIPALLLTTLSCLFFVRGLPGGRAWCFCLAGFLLFLTYAVRMDSCIVPVFMVVVGSWIFPGLYGWRRYGQASLLLAAVFGVCLLGYVLFAGSMVSPHNFLRFVLHSSPLHFRLASEAGIAVVLRSVTPMLPLVIVSLAGGGSRLHVFSFTWLLLCMVPFAVLILLGAWIETRFMAMAWTALASTCLLGLERFRVWLQRLPGGGWRHGVQGAAAAVLVAASFLLFSDAGCLWARETLGWRLAVPEHEQRVYGIADIQMVVDELASSGGRVEDLILPGNSGTLRCLFQYCGRSAAGEGKEDGGGVFGAVRLESRNGDLGEIRAIAADRLGMNRAKQVKTTFLRRGEDWALVSCARPRR